MSISELLDGFIQRDKQAVEDFNNCFWPNSPPIEARILFTEERLKDLALLVIQALRPPKEPDHE